MALRVVYRSYGGENRKGRPEYYSKLLCLVSFLRAAREVGAEPVFVNDGPIPDDRLRLMEAAGEVLARSDLGMRGSYLTALDLAVSGRWAPEDVVWFAEDDYLYQPGSLASLVRATEQLVEADYFALYASTRPFPPGDPTRGSQHRPAGWRDLPAWRVDGQDWIRIRSTTSTFGARVGALVEDRGIFRLCMVPHRSRLRDHDTCLVFQGFEPYSYRALARDAVGLSSGSASARLEAAGMAPFLLATNLRAHRRPARRRLMLAARPNLAAHLEDGQVPPGTDWAAVAGGARTWGEREGLLAVRT